jgi:uncharacterized protein (DUF1800 family)
MQTSEPRRMDQWNAAEAWQPWQPTRDQPWNLRWAAHLLRRAAFGFPAQRPNDDAWTGLNRVVKQGPGATLDELFQPPNAAFNEVVDSAGQSMALDDDVGDLRGWWLYRMLTSPQPLQERMTLFWHNHFATSINKVRRTEWMFQQNRTLREHALGKFEPLVLAISRDPATIVWLDLQRNVKGYANENFGRELMELFTLGVGNYTEADVRTMARAFTGWRTYDDRFDFDARLHDDGPKTLFGRTGNFNGDAAVRILLEQPAAARFIVRKLFRQFVSEAESPPDSLLEPLVDEFRRSGLDIEPTVRRILSSRLFFSETAYRQRIKSPVEFLIGAVVGLGASVPMQRLVSMMDGLGQDLFAPPNVKGWEGGKAWLNTATLLARDNAIWTLIGDPANRKSHPETPAGVPPAKQSDASEFCYPAGLAKSHAGDDLSAQFGFLAALFLQSDLPEPATKQLIEYLNKDSPKGEALDVRLRETLHMLLVLPESQLA